MQSYRWWCNIQSLFLIFGAITLLFFLLVGIKEITKNKLCAICGAVALTWIILLILFWKGIFQDTTILALLMGQSLLGIYYIWEKKVREQFLILRLPLLLTLTLLAYIFLKGIPQKEVFILIAILWIIFSFIFLTKQNKKMQTFVKKLVECCKKW